MSKSQVIAASIAFASLLTSAYATATTPSSGCVIIRRGERGDVHDTFIWDLHPQRNEGAYVETYTGASTSGGEKRALFGFDLSSIPQQSTVISATFSVLLSSNTSQTVRAHRALAPWGEMDATWESFGGVDPMVAGSFVSGGWGVWASMDLTELVRGWLSGEIPNHGILLAEDLAGSTSYKSSEHTNILNRPRLEICYDAPMGSITSAVWLDQNADGLRDTADPGIEGVVVDLLADAECDGFADGVAIDTAITDTGGGCTSDCGLCPAVCGNGTCELDETCSSCAGDCGECPAVCGDLTCSADEDCASCSVDCGECPVAAPGTARVAYWKKHKSAWPVNKLVLGKKTYKKADRINIMEHPIKKDFTYKLARQLIAAKLNVGVGNQSSCIEGVIAQADAWLKQHPVGSNVKGSSAAWDQAAPLRQALADYNKGLLCAPKRK